MGYLEFYWNSAGEAGHASTSAGPAGATGASQSPEAGGKRQTAGKAFQISPKADPQDTCDPRSASHLMILSKFFSLPALVSSFLPAFALSWAKCDVVGEEDGDLGQSHHLSMLLLFGDCEPVS